MQQPIISIDASDEITITCSTSNTTIYYTLDGSTPVVPADDAPDPTGPTYKYTNTFSRTPSSTGVKAVAVLSNLHAAVSKMAELSLVCSTPTISFNGIDQVTISATPADATIYYTTDGSDPVVGTSSVYSTPLTITSTTTVKAIAARANFTTSDIATRTISQVATPTIQNNGSNAVSITTETEGATIYYTTDGSTPTTSSTEYTGPLTENVSGVTINAIAVKEGMINSAIGTGSVTLQCARPIISKIGGNVTISCSFPSSGVNIHYTKDGSTPSSSSTPYSGSFSVAIGDVIKAIAIATGYNDSEVAEKTIREELTPTDGIYYINNDDDFETFVDMANSGGASYHYVLRTNVNAGSAIIEPFTGTFDGGLYTISGLNHPLFNTINGGTVKNVILDNVNISDGTNVGAVCNEATGASRIYNCGVLTSSSISGSNYVGGIVGLLDGSARVINCFSYADITSGSSCGGIVGYNNVKTKSSDIAANSGTMVMNCMFYGNITGSNPAPIYGGQIIHNKREDDTNTGLNNYCYFLYDENKSPYVTSIADANYHGALGAEERYLNRFELFRLTLNSTRSMAAFYITGNAEDKEIMAKWVLDKSIAPYPILKAQGYYPSLVNPDAEHAIDIDINNEHRNEGRKLGTLTVNIQMGTNSPYPAPTGASIETSELTLNITDKDFENYNFNYKKVQLPYYSEVGTGNYTGNRVVTGWKIVGFTGGTAGTFTNSGTDAPAFNFVDRKCTDKDKYSVSGRVFNQGAYFEVPDGVTAITIEPYWAKATYLSDANYDVTYSGTTKYGVTVSGTYSRPSVLGSQTVYNSMSDAISDSNLGRDASHTVYDYAVVLVGNYHHYTNNAPANDTKPLTIMSADLDGDHEPDNTLFYYHNGRKSVSPIRFDFLNMPGIGMVKRTWDATTDPEPGIFKPSGWFEITNTVFVRFGQFEYSDGTGTGYDRAKETLAPLILQGGIYEQFVSAKDGDARNTNYLLIGGNAWFKNFANGCHTNTFRQTPKVPINVTGGDYENFYLTGIYQPNNNPTDENAECYIDGGRFEEVAGAGMQRVDGDVTWLINAADITNFFGGGINNAQSITGNISTTITNSYVAEFYGGPKFGNMSTDKSVTTIATYCHFGEFYGAGYGGTAFNRVGYKDESNTNNSRDWDSWIRSYYKRQYDAGNGGISTNYDYEFILHSDGEQTVARFFINYASLSLASTRNVTSTLNNCTIGTFFGGGRLGSVTGIIYSTLTDCHVTGNAFGAGYSASVPTVEVWNSNKYMIPTPTYNRRANVFNNASVKFPNEQIPKESVVYLWSDTYGNTSSPFTDIADDPATTDINEEKHYIFAGVGVSLSNLGAVNGKAIITLNGNTKVDGDVFGGGDQGVVNGSTTVNIE